MSNITENNIKFWYVPLNKGPKEEPIKQKTKIIAYNYKSVLLKKI